MNFKGIAYKICNTLCISSIDEVDEVVQDIKPQSLPLTKKWMYGVIQLRGSVVPVTNLSVFANNPAKQHDIDKNSTLVFLREGWRYGIQVTDLIGMREFSETASKAGDLPNEIASLKSIVNGKFKTTEGEFFLLDLRKLTELKEFMQP